VNEEEQRKEIFELVKKFYEIKHKPKKFVAGKTKINYAGRIFDEREMINLIDSALDFWLTAGRFENEFRERFAKFLGVKHVITTNSGSSANLLAVSSLTSSKLGKDRLVENDEIITTATVFPTTVTPIIQNRLIPVFLDVELGNYNIDTNLIDEVISEKTKAIFLAHTMGNPFDLGGIMKIKKE
jgi:CDP-6-deoxy-D-xylo-4-hexulose-3-dehydrase